LGTYSEHRNGELWVWDVERLWRLSQDLCIKTVPLSSIKDFDEVCWFPADGEKPTCRVVAAHAKRIYEADFTHPIILSAKGVLMDGMHRLAKAWILGMEEVPVVQFVTDPEPDQIRPRSETAA
jgi:hypothetical protein